MQTHVLAHVRVCVGLLMLALLCCVGATPSALGLQRDDSEASAHATANEPRHDACMQEALSEVEDDDANADADMSAPQCVGPAPQRCTSPGTGARRHARERLVCSGLGRGPPLG